MLALLATFCLTSRPQQQNAEAPKYRIVALDGQTGADVWYPTSINKQGVVVGDLRTPMQPGDVDNHVQNWQAFRKEPGKPIAFLDTDGLPSYADFINNEGTVRGQAERADGEWSTFLWTAKAGMTFPPQFDGAKVEQGPNDRNEVMLIVGHRNEKEKRLDTVTSILNLSTGKRRTLEAPPGYSRPMPERMNNLGQAAGICEKDDPKDPNDFKLVIWQPDGTPVADSSLEIGGTLINDRGDVACESDGVFYLKPGDNSPTRQFEKEGVLWGLLSMNASDQCAGRFRLDGTGDDIAILVEGNKMYKLDNLIPQSPHWTLAEADAINDAGTIVGRGEFGPQKLEKAFIMTRETPEAQR